MKVHGYKNIQPPVTTTDYCYGNVVRKQIIGLKSVLSIMDDSIISASVL